MSQSVYAVCYIFGNLGPIIMVTWFFPMVMKWDIRQEALKLAKEMSGGKAELEPGQFNAIRKVVTRVYSVTGNSKAAGKTAIEIDNHLSDAAVEENPTGAVKPCPPVTIPKSRPATAWR